MLSVLSTIGDQGTSFGSKRQKHFHCHHIALRTHSLTCLPKARKTPTCLARRVEFIFLMHLQSFDLRSAEHLLSQDVAIVRGQSAHLRTRQGLVPKV